MREKVEAIAAKFAAGRLGNTIRFLESVDSTNKMALQISADEAPHGLVLVAREQTAGRGRQRRAWFSPPDLSLYCTTIIRPKRLDYPAALLSLAAALAVHDALAKHCSSPLEIKWPNDVLLKGKKVSGILGEVALFKNKVERIALGISINLRHAPEHFPEDIRYRSISLVTAEGKAPKLEELLSGLLEELNRRHDALESGKEMDIVRAVERCGPMIHGSRIAYDVEDGRRLTGTTAGLNPDGTLQVRLDTGFETAIQAGDVHLLK